MDCNFCQPLWNFLFEASLYKTHVYYNLDHLAIWLEFSSEYDTKIIEKKTLKIKNCVVTQIGS